MFEYPMKPSVNPELSDLNCHKPVLKVIGLGGGGSNAVERMMELDLQGIEFIAANTDLQALKNNPAPTKVLLGSNTTRGLGQEEIHQRDGLLPRRAGKSWPRHCQEQTWYS